MSDPSGDRGNTWAAYVRKAREAKGWTIEELADEAGVSRMTIIRWEGGRGGFKHETVERVSTALGIDATAALAVASGARTADSLPPPLPRELARLVAFYRDLGDRDRELLLQRVEWVNEWAEVKLGARKGPTDPRRTAG